MLKVYKVSKKFEDFQKIKLLYKSSFPRQEQTPINMLLRRAKKGKAIFNAYYDEDIFAGFAYIATYNDITFVWYLAVDGVHRSKGYGAQILNHIKALHPKNRIALTIEALDENAKNNAERIKRKDFYIKNSYMSTGILIRLFGMRYEVLTYGGTCTAQEILKINKKLLGAVLFAFFKPKIEESV